MVSRQGGQVKGLAALVGLDEAEVMRMASCKRQGLGGNEKGAGC
jgi:hypothetical protein